MIETFSMYFLHIFYAIYFNRILPNGMIPLFFLKYNAFS